MKAFKHKKCIMEITNEKKSIGYGSYFEKGVQAGLVTALQFINNSIVEIDGGIFNGHLIVQAHKVDPSKQYHDLLDKYLKLSEKYHDLLDRISKPEIK